MTLSRHPPLRLIVLAVVALGAIAAVGGLTSLFLPHEGGAVVQLGTTIRPKRGRVVWFGRVAGAPVPDA